ncbi:amidase domain-containing protein [Alkalibaculum sp. M08DMB]|uniref:Amidase domain-containing protein n=1 Tax=Alkalibaculum sporogenes TaxID=2655001 RepID=A0A6A7KAH4_9FIRM|nr:amidase domain-containing protein [Alkalibaculum sporogenes]MPW26187.1 amidase domain-containing protein [Alkalibaculum sporogenes]
MLKWPIRRRIIALLLVVAFITIALGMTSKLFKSDEIEKVAKQLLNDMNIAYLNGDEELLKEQYDVDTLYGKWAFEYALKKMEYIKTWSEKQGIEYTDIKSDYKFTKVSGSDQAFDLTVKSIDQYDYKYKDGDTVANSYSIAVYHYMRIEMKKDKWVITKDWFSDPMSDSLGIEEEKKPEIKEYINTYQYDNYKLEGRRKDAVKYADKYSSALINNSYNDKYRNYNPVGGDCANFASQVLHEGGGFKKNSVWNYDKGGSLAWIKAYNLTHYLLNSGRGSRIAVGGYESVYQAAYKLQPGDIVAYEEKGDIKHVSVITGYDSKGYPLVNCHNVDRHRVPWDLGWNREGIKYWFVRVHY